MRQRLGILESLLFLFLEQIVNILIGLLHFLQARILLLLLLLLLNQYSLFNFRREWNVLERYLLCVEKGRITAVTGYGRGYW